MANRAAPLPRP